MADPYAGFIDVGFPRGEGAKVLGLRSGLVRPNAAAIAAWFRGLGSAELAGETFLSGRAWHVRWRNWPTR